MASESVTKPRAGHRAIRIGPDERAFIEAVRCADCGAVLAAAAMACPGCGGRGGLQAFRAKQQGSVFSWAVVHRSYPGIPVPFVSAIVDIDEGPTLKGTLRDIAPDAVKVGVRVRLVFDEAGGARDSEGAPYVGFHFVPEGPSE